MTEKQFEFDFMKNNISKVISLGYIGGQDEDLGGYCEPLIIEYSDGIEQYVLHSMAQRRETNFENGQIKFGDIVSDHKKLIFSNKLKLEDAWSEVRAHLSINLKLPWQETNNVCDCHCTPEEFYRTKRKDLKEMVA